MFDSATRDVVRAAFARFEADLGTTRFLTGRLLPWMQGLADSPRLEEYFEHPYAYPILELPLWVGRGLDVDPDREFLIDITLSNIAGYYFIRLLDNVMDGDAETDRRLLGAATFLQIYIQRPYQRHFAADHPFWRVFGDVCTLTADVTVQDAELETVTAQDFRLVASQKVCGSKIPVAAACFRWDRTDLIPAWFRFIDCLGEPHQMLNDLMGWHKDWQHQHRTYLLSEAERRKAPSEAATAWIIRDGIDWGLSRVEGWLDEAAGAAPLANADALAFVNNRLATLSDLRAKLEPGLQAVQRLLASTSH